jgi:hypothetical protein
MLHDARMSPSTGRTAALLVTLDGSFGPIV